MFFRILTVLVVVAIAIVSWILSSPGHQPSTQHGANPAELPGYYLKNAVLTDYNESGAPSIRIEADRIDQVDHGNEVQLYNVRVNYDAPGGQTWVLFGDTAHVLPGGKIVDVSGNVRLEGEGLGSGGTAVVHTDTMRYSVPDSTATTNSDVRIDFGGHILTGRGLFANLKERTMRLESKVNGRFHR